MDLFHTFDITGEKETPGMAELNENTQHTTRTHTHSAGSTKLRKKCGLVANF